MSKSVKQTVSKLRISTDKLEKINKSMDQMYWGFEALALALSSVESVIDLRAQGLLEKGMQQGMLKAGQQVSAATFRSLTRSKVHTLLMAAYFASKLIAKRGKNLKKMFPFLENNAYVNVGADAINLVSNPINTIQTALARVQNQPNQGLGKDVLVVEASSTDENGSAAAAKAGKKKHRISTETLQKVNKKMNQLSWSFELAGLTTAVASFMTTVSAQGLHLKALHTPEIAARLNAVNADALSNAIRGARRGQNYMIFTIAYFTLRVIGSRRKNIESLIPAAKDNPTFNGVMDALSLVVSPWRVAMALMKDAPPTSETPALPAPALEQPALSQSDFELAG